MVQDVSIYVYDVSISDMAQFVIIRFLNQLTVYIPSKNTQIQCDLFPLVNTLSFIPSGPSQAAPSQYPNYPQSQGQQYAAYRPPQPGQPQGQPQRPYAFDQVRNPPVSTEHC